MRLSISASASSLPTKLAGQARHPPRARPSWAAEPPPPPPVVATPVRSCSFRLVRQFEPGLLACGQRRARARRASPPDRRFSPHRRRARSPEPAHRRLGEGDRESGPSCLRAPEARASAAQARAWVLSPAQARARACASRPVGVGAEHEAAVVGEVAVERLHGSVRGQPQPIDAGFEQPPVVRHQDACAFVFVDRLDQLAAAVDVEGGWSARRGSAAAARRRRRGPSSAAPSRRRTEPSILVSARAPEKPIIAARPRILASPRRACARRHGRRRCRQPRARRSGAGRNSRPEACSRAIILPAIGASRPAISLAKVDLPLPLGPRRPMRSSSARREVERARTARPS